MSDIHIRKQGHAGRITLTRPKALNALSHEMCLAAEKAIDAWRDDPEVALVVLDADGERAFCAGGDLGIMHRTGTAGDYETGRNFWRDEYRLNAKLAEYSKPIVSFLHGFVMGGGVGFGGHCSHRVVGESVQISMPECGIGFVPDVGGSYLLARAPGRLGDYLGLTAARMGPGDAIHVGFADGFLPEAEWEATKAALVESGRIDALTFAAAPESPMAADGPEIDRLFAGATLPGILDALEGAESPLAASALKAVRRNAPLAMAVTLEMLARERVPGLSVRSALVMEYRVSHRIMEHGDFLEGIRAAIIDKDRNPQWRHELRGVPEEAVQAMLAPLGTEELDFS